VATLKVDANLLVRVGLGSLRPELANVALNTFYGLLEMRVGIELADRMDNRQLDEFETFFEEGDDAGAFQWLSNNFPDYKEIVREAFEKLEAEVAAESAELLEATEALEGEFGRPSRSLV
jgi:succinate dehydrogenase flavin-adding protein (antitoxin of CptAB toxin-antitoxin module)